MMYASYDMDGGMRLREMVTRVGLLLVGAGCLSRIADEVSTSSEAGSPAMRLAGASVIKCLCIAAIDRGVDASTRKGFQSYGVSSGAGEWTRRHHTMKGKSTLPAFELHPINHRGGRRALRDPSQPLQMRALPDEWVLEISWIVSCC